MINFKNIIEDLYQSPLFKGVEESVIVNLIKQGVQESYAKNTVILDSTDFTENTYFVLHGRLKISTINPVSGKEQTLYLLGAGDMFDVVALLDKEKTSSVVETFDDVKLLKVPSSIVRECIIKDLQFNSNFLPYIGKRVRGLETLAGDLSLHNVHSRLVRLFLRHVDHSSVNSELKLIHDFTHNELSKLVGSSRVVVSRIMQNLKRSDYIGSNRKVIEIQNIEELAKSLEKK